MRKNKGSSCDLFNWPVIDVADHASPSNLVPNADCVPDHTRLSRMWIVVAKLLPLFRLHVASQFSRQQTMKRR